MIPTTPTLDEVKERLIDAMALAQDERAGWLEIAERRLMTQIAQKRPFKRMYDVSTVGQRMRTAREVCGMTQRQAAIRIGVRYNGYCAWELGHANMPAERLRTVALVLGVRAAWLLEGGEEGGPPVPREQLRKRITKAWKDRQDYLDGLKRARRETARLNGEYRARKRHEGV